MDDGRYNAKTYHDEHISEYWRCWRCIDTIMKSADIVCCGNDNVVGIIFDAVVCDVVAVMIFVDIDAVDDDDNGDDL